MGHKSGCHRCNKDITDLKDYGGYVVEKAITLCLDCWNKWITMRTEYYRKEQSLVGVDTETISPEDKRE